jgi:hypothetical protein
MINIIKGSEPRFESLNSDRIVVATQIKEPIQTMTIVALYDFNSLFEIFIFRTSFISLFLLLFSGLSAGKTIHQKGDKGGYSQGLEGAVFIPLERDKVCCLPAVLLE